LESKENEGNERDFTSCFKSSKGQVRGGKTPKICAVAQGAALKEEKKWACALEIEFEKRIKSFSDRKKEVRLSQSRRNGGDDQRKVGAGSL